MELAFLPLKEGKGSLHSLSPCPLFPRLTPTSCHPEHSSQRSGELLYLPLSTCCTRLWPSLEAFSLRVYFGLCRAFIKFLGNWRFKSRACGRRGGRGWEQQRGARQGQPWEAGGRGRFPLSTQGLCRPPCESWVFWVLKGEKG